jgi:hypothetical protein
MEQSMAGPMRVNRFRPSRRRSAAVVGLACRGQILLRVTTRYLVTALQALGLRSSSGIRGSADRDLDPQAARVRNGLVTTCGGVALISLGTRYVESVEFPDRAGRALDPRRATRGTRLGHIVTPTAAQ